MPKDYDHRRSDRPPPRRGDNKQNDRRRSRSRSPDGAQDERARREALRRAEMERLRAENEEEEKHLAALDHKSEDSSGTAAARKPQEEIVQVDEEELEGLDEEEQMRKLMGIEGFGSTKGTKVDSNHNSLASGVASKNKRRTYRQFMNRKGGFNRPLDKMD